ncbi:monovalent cation/H+ antiporter complex subunit F [Pseudomonas aeruginosa]|uniref:monovalent cation/H+ antiporter complex subunit F n=1 Tax=Pseudomonas aeruginosa TaxID=287 RepID=UPI003D663070
MRDPDRHRAHRARASACGSRGGPRHLPGGRVALCVAASLATRRTVFLDVAIGLALVGFVGTVGWARLIERSAPSDTQEERR